MAILFKTILFVFFAFQIFRPPDQVTGRKCISCVAQNITTDDGKKLCNDIINPAPGSPSATFHGHECPDGFDLCVTTVEMDKANLIQTSRGCVKSGPDEKIDNCCDLTTHEENDKKMVQACYCNTDNCNIIMIVNPDVLYTGPETPPFKKCVEPTEATTVTTTADTPTNENTTTEDSSPSNTTVAGSTDPPVTDNSTHLRGSPQLLLLTIFIIFSLISCFNKQE